jgi:hypothetical protein
VELFSEVSLSFYMLATASYLYLLPLRKKLFFLSELSSYFPLSWILVLNCGGLGSGMTVSLFVTGDSRELRRSACLFVIESTPLLGFTASYNSKLSLSQVVELKAC